MNWAGVDLFPESAALHFRLAAVLDWAEKYHAASVPGPLQQKRAFHLEQAIRLDPGLKKYLNYPSATGLPQFGGNG